LVLNGELHTPFLQCVVARSRRLQDTTRGQLEQLRLLAQEVLPDLPDLRALLSMEGRLGRLLEELPLLGDDDRKLHRWRIEILPLLQGLQRTIPDLLRALDRSVACDVLAILESELGRQKAALSASGINFDLRCDQGHGPLMGWIPAERLTRVLECLFNELLLRTDKASATRLLIRVRPTSNTIAICLRHPHLGRLPDTDGEYPPSGRQQARRTGERSNLRCAREILQSMGGSLETARTAGGSPPGLVLSLALFESSEGSPASSRHP
ncbi:MAG: hypothetical protein ACE5GW_13360, partial [Planctomycetota bacterium]